MSLEGMEAVVNAQENAIGVRASILQISSTESILVLTATDAAQSINYTPTAGTDLIAPGHLVYELTVPERCDKVRFSKGLSCPKCLIF